LANCLELDRLGGTCNRIDRHRVTVPEGCQEPPNKVQGVDAALSSARVSEHGRQLPAENLKKINSHKREVNIMVVGGVGVIG
jgi:hypothetical protein